MRLIYSIVLVSDNTVHHIGRETEKRKICRVCGKLTLHECVIKAVMGPLSPPHLQVDQ